LEPFLTFFLENTNHLSGIDKDNEVLEFF